MGNKREYERYSCSIKLNYEYYEGNPDEVDIDTTVPIKGKGVILDISRGGLFFVSGSRFGVNHPVRLHFSTKRGKHAVEGTIVRTGLIENNPSELAQRYAGRKVKGDSYTAIRFNEALPSLDGGDL